MATLNDKTAHQVSHLETRRPASKKSKIVGEVHHDQQLGPSRSRPSVVERLTSNPLSDRSDMIQLLRDLLCPLEDCLSPGSARVRLGYGGAGFDTDAAGLEGYARALWGLGPLLATEPDHPLFVHSQARWIRGLVNGTDPLHEEYWGDCKDRDQRLVEQAAIVSVLSGRPL